MTKKNEGEKALSSRFESSEIQRILDPFLKKREIIIAFFEERALSEVSFSKNPENCEWCARFKPGGLRTCLNCGTILDTLKEV